MRIRRSRRLVVGPRLPWRSFLGLGAIAILLAFSLAPDASSRPSIPIAGPSTALQGVDCISGSDCWAVGVVVNGAGTGLNQAEHWNGKRWKRVSTPDPSGKASGDLQQLLGVSCVSRSDCWAVGSYLDTSSQARLDQALHWNGKKWKLVASPQPAQPKMGEFDGLSGVSCVSGSDCWAVGVTGILGQPALNQVLHWKGGKWSPVSVRDPAGKTGTVTNVLRGVDCVRATDCWTVGTYTNSSHATLNQTLRFNGRKWKFVSPPSPGSSSGTGLPTLTRQLAAVACPSATACRAVGSYPKHSGGTFNEALRFNGKRWSVMTTPDPGGQMHNDALSGVACTSTKDCWAVGGVVANNGGTLNPGSRNQALRWDGKKWSAVFTPNPAGKAAMDRNRLDAVTCVSSTDCWAVGTETNAKATSASDQMLHWNGRKWKTK